jgi:enoyl-CoA hydratase/carnithine racemase
MSDAVLLEQKGMVAILTINKPKANQLSHDVFETMRKYLDTLEIDKSVCLLLLVQVIKYFALVPTYHRALVISVPLIF